MSCISWHHALTPDRVVLLTWPTPCARLAHTRRTTDLTRHADLDARPMRTCHPPSAAARDTQAIQYCHQDRSLARCIVNQSPCRKHSRCACRRVSRWPSWPPGPGTQRLVEYWLMHAIGVLYCKVSESWHRASANREWLNASGTRRASPRRKHVY